MTARLKTVSVPAGFEDLFGAAEHVVSRYFRERRDHPEHGTIEISGERYILVRGAALSVEFFGLVRELYGVGRAQEADEFARNILFDLAHAIGRKDAKSFHTKMGLTEPIARLSATKDAAGTGLGLSTVYGIVQRSGGTVSVESKPGEGATFTIILPAVEPRRRSTPTSIVARGERPGRGEVVLCVEDQPRLRRALEASLRELGFEPLMASDPRDALSRIQGGAVPSALLTDIMLPLVNGIELAERVEAAVPGIAVVFMSGNPSDALDARRAEGKPVAFLPKPFTLEGLGAAIRDAIDALQSG